MEQTPYIIAAAIVGTFLVLVLCILLGAWAERHGKPPAPIQWDGVDEP